ncbi:uncharacterized protein LOC144486288 isoform X2 [Mustelus asterias]
MEELPTETKMIENSSFRSTRFLRPSPSFIISFLRLSGRYLLVSDDSLAQAQFHQASSNTKQFQYHSQSTVILPTHWVHCHKEKYSAPYCLQALKTAKEGKICFNALKEDGNLICIPVISMFLPQEQGLLTQTLPLKFMVHRIRPRKLSYQLN